MREGSRTQTTTTLLVILLAVLVAAAGLATTAGAEAPAASVGPTPPRLAFVDGQVSFWRPGVAEWTDAQVNTPLASGDALAAGSPGTLEIQIGGGAYVRAWAQTQLGIQTVEPDSVQLKLTTGHAALDLRRLAPGQTIELDTPSAALTIEGAGYYRIDVAGTRTTVITRHGGRATLAPAGGAAFAIGENAQVVVEGTTSPSVAAHAAPGLDPWDQWNIARTDALLKPAGARYVSSDVYGVSDLDRYGTWRITESYGSVWVPNDLPTDWAPYSNGHWIWDPLYGWTWVESAPWGWAPFHYGRWVSVSGSWAWAPGPLVARPVYAPALVAFFGGRPGIGAGVAGPPIGWVALAWGEPLIPWWGQVGFVGVPWWGGWGGPRIVNSAVVSRTAVVTATSVTVFGNVSVRNAVVAVPRDRFGRSPVARVRVSHVDVRSLEPVRGTIAVPPGRTSLVSDIRRDVRPPGSARRPVVMTRDPDGPARRPPGHGLAVPRAAEEPPPRFDEPSAQHRSSPSTRLTPAPPSVPTTITGPGQAPGAPALRPQRPRIELPSTLPRPGSSDIRPMPPRRSQPAPSDQPARIEPGSARAVASHATPATSLRPPLSGRRLEAPASTSREGRGAASQRGAPSR